MRMNNKILLATLFKTFSVCIYSMFDLLSRNFLYNLFYSRTLFTFLCIRQMHCVTNLQQNLEVQCVFFCLFLSSFNVTIISNLSKTAERKIHLKLYLSINSDFTLTYCRHNICFEMFSLLTFIWQTNRRCLIRLFPIINCKTV